jgi:hypothetical protein
MPALCTVLLKIGWPLIALSRERLTAFPVKSRGSNSPFTGQGCGLCRSDTHYEGIIVLDFDSLGTGMFLMRASWCTNTLSFQTPHLCKARL